MSDRKKFLVLLCLPVLGIAAAIGIGEIVARTVWKQPEQRQSVARSVPDDLPVIAPRVRQLRNPNLEGIFRGAYFRTNSSGFRGPEFEELPAPDVFRIAVVGDSVTMGAGVANDETYPALLPTRLEARFPERKFEAMNFGMSGLNTAMIHRRATNLAPRHHPHLIVYGVTLNDIEGRHYAKKGRPKALREQRRRYTRFEQSDSYLLRQIWPRLQSLQDMIAPPRGTYLAELRFNYFENPAAWRDFETALHGIAQLGEELDAPLVVFIHTTLGYLNRFHPFQPMYRQVASSCEGIGIPVIHSLDEHLGNSAESLWVSPLDPHPNPRGHEILADALAQGLSELPKSYFSPSSSPR